MLDEAAAALIATLSKPGGLDHAKLIEHHLQQYRVAIVNDIASMAESREAVFSKASNRGRVRAIDGIKRTTWQGMAWADWFRAAGRGEAL